MRLVPLLVSILLPLGVCADMRTVTDANGTVQVPLEPKRIVSLHDGSITHPLIELGAPVVASAGRLDTDGTPYLRGIRDLRGEGFEDLGLAFLGTFNQLDVERIAMLKPDLIIAPPWQQEMLPGLERIAPVVTIPWTDSGTLELYRLMAEATGRLERYQRLKDRYEQRVRQVTQWIGEPEKIQIATMQAWDGQITLYRSYGALTQVLGDIGFGQPSQIRNHDGPSMSFSPELLPELDADFLIDTFEPNFGGEPDDPKERVEQALHSWCERLFACRNRQYLVLERSKTGESFAGLNYVLDQITTHIAGRDYVLRP